MFSSVRNSVNRVSIEKPSLDSVRYLIQSSDRLHAVLQVVIQSIDETDYESWLI